MLNKNQSISIDEYRKLSKKKNKYNACSVLTEDGYFFQSRLEYLFYKKLMLEKEIGNILFFLRQVPFYLPGRVKYICDFVVFYKDKNVKFFDIKGRETTLFITKKKLVESLYPVEISIVKKTDF